MRINNKNVVKRQNSLMRDDPLEMTNTEWHEMGKINHHNIDLVESEYLSIPKVSKAVLIKNPVQRHMYLYLEDPSSSSFALWLNILIAVLIIVNALVMCLETLPSVQTYIHYWSLFQMITISLFLAELIARIFVHSYSLRAFGKFLISPLTIIDILSCFFFFLNLFFNIEPFHDSKRFSILRIMRLLRMFRAFKYQSLVLLSVEVMIIALNKSKEALLVVFGFMMMFDLTFGTLLYFAEMGTFSEKTNSFLNSKGQASSFSTIFDAMWFVTATLTTTGYGDVYPITGLGKVLSFLTMGTGILLVALPSIIVGRNYLTVWEGIKPYTTEEDNNNNNQHIMMKDSNAEINNTIPLENVPLRSSLGKNLDPDVKSLVSNLHKVLIQAEEYNQHLKNIINSLDSEHEHFFPQKDDTFL
jgi:hypothetical protein